MMVRVALCLATALLCVVHGMRDMASREIVQDNCEEKIADGGTCQVMVTFYGSYAFMMEFGSSTTFADVKQKLHTWIEDKAKSHGDKDPPPKDMVEQFQVVCVRCSGSHGAKPVAEDSMKILDFGVTEKSEIQFSGRAVGGIAFGMQYKPSEFDFVVNLVVPFTDESGKTHRGVCTGTIYGDHVLTAAHCLVDVNVADIIVQLHDNTEIRATDYWTEKYNAEGDKRRPWFPDVAIVRLESKYYPKVKFALATDRTSVPVGTQAFLASYGMQENKKVGFGVGRFYVGHDCHVTGHKADTRGGCASSGSSSSTSSCGGDSGAPWFVPKQDGSVLIFAVHKAGDDCLNQAKNNGSVFTWLDTLYYWWSKFGDFKGISQ